MLCSCFFVPPRASSSSSSCPFRAITAHRLHPYTSSAYSNRLFQIQPIRARQRGGARSESRETDGKEFSFFPRNADCAAFVWGGVFPLWSPRLCVRLCSSWYRLVLVLVPLQHVWLWRPGSLLQWQLRRRRRGARRGWRRTEEEPDQETVPRVPPTVQSRNRPNRVHLQIQVSVNVSV